MTVFNRNGFVLASKVVNINNHIEKTSVAKRVDNYSINSQIEDGAVALDYHRAREESKQKVLQELLYLQQMDFSGGKTLIAKENKDLKAITDLTELYQEILNNSPTLQDVKKQNEIREMVKPEKLVQTFDSAMPSIKNSIQNAFKILTAKEGRTTEEQNALNEIEKKVMSSLNAAEGIIAAIKQKNKNKALDVRDFDGFLDHFKTLMNDLDDFYIQFYELAGSREEVGGGETQLALRSVLSQTLALASVGYVGYTVLTNPNSALGQGMGIATFLSLFEFAKSSYFFQGLLNDKSKFPAMEFGAMPHRFVTRVMRDAEGHVILDKEGQPRTEQIKTIDYANMPLLGLDRYRNTGMPELSSILAGIRDNLRNAGYRQEVLNDDAKNIYGDPNYGDQKELRFIMAEINRMQELVKEWKKDQKVDFTKEERAIADLVFDLSTSPEFNFLAESVILDEGQDLGIDSGKLSRLLTHLGNRGGEIAVYSSVAHFLLDEFTGVGRGLKTIGSAMSETQKEKISKQINWMIEQLAAEVGKFNVRKFADSEYMETLLKTLSAQTGFEHEEVLLKLFKAHGTDYFNEYVETEALKAGTTAAQAEKLGRAIFERAKKENAIPQIATLGRLAAEGIINETDRNALANLLAEKYRVAVSQALDLIKRIEKSNVAELARKDCGHPQIDAQTFSKNMHLMQYMMQIGMNDINTGEDTFFIKDRIRFLSDLFQKKDSEFKENIQKSLEAFVRSEKTDVNTVLHDITLFNKFKNSAKGGKALSKPVQQYLNDYRDWYLWQVMNGSKDLNFDLLGHLHKADNKVEMKDRFAGLFEYILGTDKKTAELLSHYLGDQVAKHPFSGTEFEEGVTQKMNEKDYSFEQARLELWAEYKEKMTIHLNAVMDQIDEAFKIASKNDKGELQNYQNKIAEILNNKKVNLFHSDETQEALARTAVSPINDLQRKEMVDSIFEELERAHNKLFRSTLGHYSLHNDIGTGVMKFVHSLKTSTLQSEMGQGQKRQKNQAYLNRLLKEKKENIEKLNQIKNQITELLKENPEFKSSFNEIDDRLKHLFNAAVGRGRGRYKENFNRELAELESLIVDVFFGKADLTVLQPLNVDRNQHAEIQHLLIKDVMPHEQYQKIHHASVLKSKEESFHRSLFSKTDYEERKRHYRFLTGEEGKVWEAKSLKQDLILIEAAIAKRNDQEKVLTIEKNIKGNEKNIKSLEKHISKIQTEKKQLHEYDEFLKKANLLPKEEQEKEILNFFENEKNLIKSFEGEGIGQLARFYAEKHAYVSQMGFLEKVQEKENTESFQSLKSLMRDLVAVHAKDNELILDTEEVIRQISTGSDKQKDYEEKLRFLKNEYDKVSHEIFELDKLKEPVPEALHVKLKTIQDKILLYQTNIFEAPTMNNRFHYPLAAKILKLAEVMDPTDGNYVKEIVKKFEAENGHEIQKISFKILKYDRTPYGYGMVDGKKLYTELVRYSNEFISKAVTGDLVKQYKKLEKNDTENLYGLGTEHHEDPHSEKLFHRYVVEQNMSYLHGTYGGTKAHQAAAHAGGENVNQIVFQRFNSTVDQFLHPELTLNPPRLIAELQNNFLARIAFIKIGKKIDYENDEEYRLAHDAFADDVVEKIKKYRYRGEKSPSETVTLVMQDLVSGIKDDAEKARILKEMNLNKLALEKIVSEVAILMEASEAALDYKALYVAQGLIDSPTVLPAKAQKALEKAGRYLGNTKKYKPLSTQSEINDSLKQVKNGLGEYWKKKKAQLQAKNWTKSEINELEQTLSVRRRHIEAEIEQKQAFAQNSLKALVEAKDRIVNQIKNADRNSIEETFVDLINPLIEEGVLINEELVLSQILEKHLSAEKDLKQKEYIKNIIEEQVARLKLELVELREIFDYDRIHVGAWYGIAAQFHPDSKYHETKALSTYEFSVKKNKLEVSKTGAFNFSTYREILKMGLGEQMMVRRELYMLPPGETYSLEELTTLSLSLADRPLYHTNLGKVKELGMAQMKMARLVDHFYAQGKVDRNASASEQKKQIFELLQAYQLASRLSPESEKELLSAANQKKISEAYQSEKIDQILNVLKDPEQMAQIEYENFLNSKAPALKKDPDLQKKLIEADNIHEARKILKMNSSLDKTVIEELVTDLDKLSRKLNTDIVDWAKKYFSAQLRHLSPALNKKIAEARDLSVLVTLLSDYQSKLSTLSAKDEKKYLQIADELQESSLNPYQFSTLDLLQLATEAAQDLKTNALSFQDLGLMPTQKVSQDLKNGFNQDLVEMIAGTWFHIDVTEELDTDNFPFDTAKNRALRHFKKRDGVIVRKEDATLQTSQYFFGPEKRLRGQGLMGEIFRRVMGRGFDQGTYYEDGRLTRVLGAIGFKPAHHGTRGGLALIMGCFIHKAHHAFDRASYFTRIPIFERAVNSFFLDNFNFKAQEAGNAANINQGVTVYNKLRYYTMKTLPIAAMVASGAFSFVSSFGFQMGTLGLPALSTLGIGLVGAMSISALGADPRSTGASGKISSAFYAFKDTLNQRNTMRLLWVLGGITMLLGNTLPFVNDLTGSMIPAFGGAAAIAVGALSGMLAGMFSLPSVIYKPFSEDTRAKKRYEKAMNQRVADSKNFINQQRLGVKASGQRFWYQIKMQSPIYLMALAVAGVSGILSGGATLPIVAAILGGGALVTGLQIHRRKSFTKFLTRNLKSKKLLEWQNKNFLSTRWMAALKILGVAAASVAVFPFLGTSISVVGTVMMFNAVLLPNLIYQFNKDYKPTMPTNRWLQKSIGLGIGAMGASWIGVGVLGTALGVSSPLLAPLAALTALTALVWYPEFRQKFITKASPKVMRMWLGEYDYPVEKDSEDAMMTLYIKLLGYNLRYHDSIDGPSSGVNSESSYRGQRYRWNTGNILLKGAMERAWAMNPQALSTQNISRMNHVVGTSAYAIQKYTLNTLMMMLAVGGMPAFSFGYTDQFINPLKTFIGINLANYLVFMNNFNTALVKEGASKRQVNEMFGVIDMMTDVNHSGYINRGIFREDADFNATKAPPIAVKAAFTAGKMFKSFYGYGGTLGLSTLMTSMFVIGSVFSQGSFYGIPMALLLFWNYRPFMNVYHALFKISRQGREDYGVYKKESDEQQKEIKELSIDKKLFAQLAEEEREKQRQKIIAEFEKENLSKSPVLNTEILAEFIQFNQLRESFHLNSVKQAFHRQVEMKETHKDFSVAAAYKELGLKNVLKLKFYAATTWRMERLVAGFEKHRSVFKKTMQISRRWFRKTSLRTGYIKWHFSNFKQSHRSANAMKEWIKEIKAIKEAKAAGKSSGK